jgi:hypothetical protein
MPVLTLPPAVPSKPQHLRAFALGPMLHQWSEDFQPEMLDTATKAMQILQGLVERVSGQLAELSDSCSVGLWTLDEMREEETRLTILLERQVAMLDRLGAFHQRTTSVSAAALLHAMTRGQLASESGRTERNATPRRSLASASDQVITEAH